MHTPAELLLNFSQFRPHALANRRAFYRKPTIPVLSADMRKAQEIECLRLTFSSSSPVLFGEPPEFDPARLVWVEFQSELLQPRSEILE
jgi:hypothetical protein